MCNRLDDLYVRRMAKVLKKKNRSRLELYQHCDFVCRASFFFFSFFFNDQFRKKTNFEKKKN